MHTRVDLNDVDASVRERLKIMLRITESTAADQQGLMKIWLEMLYQIKEFGVWKHQLFAVIVHRRLSKVRVRCIRENRFRCQRVHGPEHLNTAVFAIDIDQLGRSVFV